MGNGTDAYIYVLDEDDPLDVGDEFLDESDDMDDTFEDLYDDDTFSVDY